MKKLLFITGTRADYGKIKALIREVEASEEFEAFIYCLLYTSLCDAMK